jgi:DNA-directed RNA polymerase subunit RPC12/RpoP
MDPWTAAQQAIATIEWGAGSEHYRHGRETMQADAIKAIEELRPPEPKYRCPRCSQALHWTDGKSTEAGDEVDEYWCQYCGEESPLADCEKVAT